MTAVLAAESIARDFPARRSLLGRVIANLRAVDDVSLEVERGKTLAVIGESGSGKSTVARMLMGMIVPSSGRVRVDGVDLATLGPEARHAFRRRVQMIFQDPFGSLDPRMRVADAIAEPLAIHRPELSAAQRAGIVSTLLARVGLSSELGARLPSALSGGQRQRVVIARALAIDPEIVIADEPVSALDVSIQAQIINLLVDLQRERGLTYVFVSHDLRVVEHVADDVAVMYLGRVVERAKTAALFATPRHPYTRALLSAVPDPRATSRQRPVLEGEPPSPLAAPAGCAFHPRCPLRATLGEADRSRCDSERPSLRVIGENSAACHFADRA